MCTLNVWTSISLALSPRNAFQLLTRIRRNHSDRPPQTHPKKNSIVCTKHTVHLSFSSPLSLLSFLTYFGTLPNILLFIYISTYTYYSSSSSFSSSSPLLLIASIVQLILSKQFASYTFPARLSYSYYPCLVLCGHAFANACTCVCLMRLSRVTVCHAYYHLFQSALFSLSLRDTPNQNAVKSALKSGPQNTSTPYRTAHCYTLLHNLTVSSVLSTLSLIERRMHCHV